MKWDKPSIDRDLVRAFSTRYDIDLLTASILVRRGITDPGEILFFLESDMRYLHNPFLFVDMDVVVRRLLQAVEEGEKVVIFGDRDVDGIASTVLMYQALLEKGVDVSWRLPEGDDPYGLTEKAVRDASEDGVTLLITVDCGISNFTEITLARELGIDTLVLDHHNPHETLPPAYGIIDPKMEDSGFPFRDLAGCGVVAKVLWALEFSSTRFYDQRVCLLNIIPGNGTFILELVKVENLEIIDRSIEHIAPGIFNPAESKLGDFFSCPLFVYDGRRQESWLREIFGQDAEIDLFDLAPEIWKEFPALKEKSLLRMLEISRMARYSEERGREIDILFSLFVLFVTRSCKNLSEDFRSKLDLVALGTLADLMPLMNENRILVRLGIEELMSTKRKGLRELLFRQNLMGKPLGARDLSWHIAPVINATGRLGMPERAAALILEEDDQLVRKIAEEVLDLNRERKRLGDEVWNQVQEGARKSFERSGGRIVLVSGSNIHRGITGIISSRLVNTFGVPSITVSFLDGRAIGSVRSAGGVNVKDFLSRLADLLNDFGGHDFAAGFNMEAERFPLLEERVYSQAASLSKTEGEETLSVDAELPLDYMTPDIVKVVERFEPFGEGNAPLIFLVKGAYIRDLALMGKTERVHVRMLVDTGTFKWPAVFWNAAERVGSDFKEGDRVSLLFRFGRNYFQNKETIQLIILDIKNE
ncbi:MAG: single-stranded-DNA-specific exonuclease RecJ [Spirochaetales bacterium]|nr:single-stranded-DNA-specific exonuclease RecJ [Spirochaetales bacterium]